MKIAPVISYFVNRECQFEKEEVHTLFYDNYRFVSRYPGIENTSISVSLSVPKAKYQNELKRKLEIRLYPQRNEEKGIALIYQNGRIDTIKTKETSQTLEAEIERIKKELFA